MDQSITGIGTIPVTWSGSASVSILTTATGTSDAISGHGQSKDISIHVTRTSGASPNYTVTVETSYDGTLWATPSTGGTALSGITATADQSAPITIPVCRYWRLKILNSSANTCVFAVTVQHQ